MYILCPSQDVDSFLAFQMGSKPVYIHEWTRQLQATLFVDSVDVNQTETAQMRHVLGKGMHPADMSRQLEATHTSSYPLVSAAQEMMQGSIEATSITYSAAILACSAGEQWQVALGLLEQVGKIWGGWNLGHLFTLFRHHKLELAMITVLHCLHNFVFLPIVFICFHVFPTLCMDNIHSDWIACSQHTDSSWN